MFTVHFLEISIAFVLKLYSLNVIKKSRIESRACESNRIRTSESIPSPTVNTHPEQCAANAAAFGVKKMVFGALLKGLTSVVVLSVERALDIHSPHLQSLPDLRLEPATFRLQVRLSNH